MIDANDPSRVLHVVDTIKPHYVINCIGIIKQRKEQSHDPAQMITVNALLPHLIQGVLKKYGGKLITFSSDCVFLGNHAPYDEKCTPDAWSLYGRTKHLGEVDSPALTLRTSFIGFEIKGFTSLLEWFVEAAIEQKKNGTLIEGYEKAIWSGVSTAYLSEWLVRQVNEDMKCLSGIYNFGAKKINKFELLRLINNRFGLNALVVPSKKFEADKVCDRELDSRKIWTETNLKIPDWHFDELLQGLVEDYKFYKQ
jgi:dTDP-4-dehydrorhamnose reductase